MIGSDPAERSSPAYERFMGSSSRNRLASIAHLGGGAIVGTAALTVLAVFLARILDVEEFGTVRLIASYWLVMSLIGRLSMVDALVSYVSGATDKDEARGYFATALTIVLIVSVAVTLVVELGIWKTDVWTGELALALAIVALFLPLDCIAALCGSMVQALGWFATVARFAAMSGFTMLILVGGSAYFYGMPGWIAGRALSFSVIFIVGLYLCRDYLKIAAASKVLATRLLKFARSQFVSGLFAIGMQSLDVIVLKQISGDLRAVGIYGIAILVFRAVSFVPNSISKVFLREIAIENRNRGAIGSIIGKAILTNLVVAIGVALMLSFVVAPVLAGFLGPDYAESVPLLRVLCVGYVFFAVLTQALLANIALQAPKYSVAANGVGFVSLLAALIAFIPSYGALGAAWAVNLSCVFASATGVLLLWRRIRKFTPLTPTVRDHRG